MYKREVILFVFKCNFNVCICKLFCFVRKKFDKSQGKVCTYVGIFLITEHLFMNEE